MTQQILNKKKLNYISLLFKVVSIQKAPKQSPKNAKTKNKKKNKKKRKKRNVTYFNSPCNLSLLMGPYLGVSSPRIPYKNISKNVKTRYWFLLGTIGLSRPNYPKGWFFSKQKQWFQTLLNFYDAATLWGKRLFLKQWF